MDRDYRMMDGRNPYGSRGGYVTSRRSRRRGRRDRGMGEDYAYNRDYRDYADREYASRRGDRAYSQQDMEMGSENYKPLGNRPMGSLYPFPVTEDSTRDGHYGYPMMRHDYESDMARGGRRMDMEGDMRYYSRGRDGHYPMSEGKTYFPIEAMGTFSGYYGMPEQDYARGRYMMDYAGDYGEKLTKEELEHWHKKLMKEVDEKDKQFFQKEMIGQKAKQMGVQMKDYNEDELAVATLMVYTDYCKTIKPLVGSNMDIYVKLARDWLEDEDSSVKGGEKLAIYYDCIIEGEDE